MTITGSALSLNVPDVEASTTWVQRHLGFAEVMAADGFSSLAHPEAGFNLIFLRTGLESFRPASAAGQVDRLLVVSPLRTSTPSTRGCVTTESRSSPRSRPSRGASGTSRWPIPTAWSTNSCSGSRRPTRSMPAELRDGARDPAR